MSKKSRKWIIIVTAVMGLLAAGMYFRDRVMLQTNLAPTAEFLVASGVIQSQQVSIASEFGGLITKIPVAKGAQVTPGSVVVQLDTAYLDGQIAIGEALVATAEANLELAAAGARPGQIAVAEAQLDLVEAALLVTQQAISDTQTLIDNPQEIDLQIAVMRAQITSAQEQYAQAAAVKDALEVAKIKFEDTYADFDGGGLHKFGIAEGTLEELVTDVLPDEVSDLIPDDFGENIPSTGEHTYTFRDYELYVNDGRYQLSVWKDIAFPLEATLLPNQWWQAWVGVNAASAQSKGLQAQLNQLYNQRANPQNLKTQLDEMMALEAQLKAQVIMAETKMTALKAGLTQEEMNVIEAQVNQARAGLQALVAQRDMYTLTAPISGTVIDIVQHEGEIAAQGAPLISIADLNNLTVTVYVPEAQLGDVWLDQGVQVVVDSFPDQTFEGRVHYIADSAEFTPRNVATVEERQNLVFAVDIRIINVHESLKPGMPADVLFTGVNQTKP